MDLVMLVSLLNAGTFSIAILGCLIFINTAAYRGVCVLLGLVSVAATANVLEDLQLSREPHLVSPIFVLGYGPALYFAVKRLISGPVGYRMMWHLLPMLLILPFTAYTQSIIAIGTVWRIVYAVLTLNSLLTLIGSYQRSGRMQLRFRWHGLGG